MLPHASVGPILNHSKVVGLECGTHLLPEPACTNSSRLPCTFEHECSIGDDQRTYTGSRDSLRHHDAFAVAW